MKTLTPRQVGPFVESLLNEESGGGDILIVRDGETLARLEEPGHDPTIVRRQFKELKRRKAGIQVDRETLKAWRGGRGHGPR